MSTFGKSLIIVGAGILGFGLGFGAWTVARGAEPPEFAVFGEIAQATGPQTFGILEEKAFESISDCWIWSQEFNAEAVGTGYISFCWPAPVLEELPTS